MGKKGDRSVSIDGKELQPRTHRKGHRDSGAILQATTPSSKLVTKINGGMYMGHLGHVSYTPHIERLATANISRYTEV